jgi:hypothetical protein
MREQEVVVTGQGNVEGAQLRVYICGCGLGRMEESLRDKVWFAVMGLDLHPRGQEKTR